MCIRDSVNPDSKDESKAGKTEGVNFSERYSDVMGKVNESLSKIDWTQMGKYGKAAGIIAVVVLGQWSWQNLTTSEKRTAVFDKVQNLKKEYLG